MSFASASLRDKRSAKVIPFTQTPIYRIHGHDAVPGPVVLQVLDIVSDRLDEADPGLLSRDRLSNLIEGLIGETVGELGLRLSRDDRAQLVERIVAEMVGFGPLEALLADPTVDDILINGPDRVYVERRGRLQATDAYFRSPRHILRIAQRLAASVGQSLTEQRPVADLRLADGSRVNIVAPTLAMGSAVISVRKSRNDPISLARMVRQQNLSAAMAELLRAAVDCRLNIVVVGGSDSGKTTLLSALAQCVAPRESVAVIEEVADFRTDRADLVRLETRSRLSADGEVTQRDLLRDTLALKPDRLVMGELRGGEVVELLDAMTAGRDGVLAALHASDGDEAVVKLETLAALGGSDAEGEQLRRRIVQAVDLVVTLERPAFGSRRVVQIAELIGAAAGDGYRVAPLFTFKADGTTPDGHPAGAFHASGRVPQFLEKARALGLDRAVQTLLQA